MTTTSQSTPQLSLAQRNQLARMVLLHTRSQRLTRDILRPLAYTDELHEMVAIVLGVESASTEELHAAWQCLLDACADKIARAKQEPTP